jgi:hypothetical protein
MSSIIWQEREKKCIACIKVTESSCLEVLLNLWLILPLCVSALISNGKEFFLMFWAYQEKQNSPWKKRA